MDAETARSIDGVFRALDRELWVVTAAHGAKRGGLVATWISQTSLDSATPRVVAGLAPNHHTTELVLASGAFGLHLLAARHMPLVWRFAIGSGRDRDKLAELATTNVVTGSPILGDCVAWLDCRVIHHIDAGDRFFFWADVMAGARREDERPIREQEALATADPAKLEALRDDREADIALQRPMAETWLRSIGLIEVPR